jgi:hypothetical protein
LTPAFDLDGRIFRSVENSASGVWRSVPERLPDGRLCLRESWRWTSGDLSTGESVVEELPGA